MMIKNHICQFTSARKYFPLHIDMKVILKFKGFEKNIEIIVSLIYTQKSTLSIGYLMPTEYTVGIIQSTLYDAYRVHCRHHTESFK